MKALHRWLLTLTLLLVASSASAAGGGHWSSWARRPWSPRDLGLTVWFTAGADYNASTADWIDRSTNGNNGSAVNATIPSAGTAINSRATVHFTNLGGVLTGSLSLEQYTVAAVEKTSNAGYVWVHGTDGAVNGAHQYTGTSETNYFARSSVVSHKKFSSGYADGAAHFLVTTFDGTTAGNLLYDSGVIVSETTVTGNDPGTGPTNAAFYVGTNQAGNTSLNGDLAMLLIVPRVITAAELARLSFYTLALWGV